MEQLVTTLLSNVFNVARACSYHATRGQTRLAKDKNKFPWKHTKARAGFNWRNIAADASNVIVGK